MIAYPTDRRCCLSSHLGHYNLGHAIRGSLQSVMTIWDFRHLRGQETHIIDLCVEFADKKVTEKTDSVYSLLGMTNPPSAIDPDYRLPIRSLFTGICADYINYKHSLSCLPFAGLGHNVSGLPSLVVDWTAIDDAYYSDTWSSIIGLLSHIS